MTYPYMYSCGVTSSGGSYYYSSKGGTQNKEKYKEQQSQQRQVNSVHGLVNKQRPFIHILLLSLVKPKVNCELF